ncbi:MAG TPA: 4-hydroxy-tetrahydrodipicolinate synthase [Candidatus Acidoferrum sp.]|nr:4-hydroxy-tetrahydrodipicolinate synthase [Candidatus Acidoferrum sp.]
MSRLGTICTAMITPFDERGNIDSKEAARIARWLVGRGNDGLVVAGTTGEGATLDAGERRELFGAVKAAIGDGAAMIANVGTNDVRSTIRAGKEAQDAGADALLVVVPPYVKPTQGGMLEFFGTIADATPLPVVVYNIPGRTAANMLPATLLELATRHKNVAGVKESSGDLKQIATIVRDRPDGFIVWSGDDHLFLPCLAVGADGVVGVATHLCSREYREMFDAFRSGDVTRAAAIHNAQLELVDALFAVTSPIAIKWAMGELGFKVGRCRPPLDRLPAALVERLRPLVASYLTTA